MFPKCIFVIFSRALPPPLPCLNFHGFSYVLWYVLVGSTSRGCDRWGRFITGAPLKLSGGHLFLPKFRSFLIVLITLHPPLSSSFYELFLILSLHFNVSATHITCISLARLVPPPPPNLHEMFRFLPRCLVSSFVVKVISTLLVYHLPPHRWWGGRGWSNSFFIITCE